MAKSDDFFLIYNWKLYQSKGVSFFFPGNNIWSPTYLPRVKFVRFFFSLGGKKTEHILYFSSFPAVLFQIINNLKLRSILYCVAHIVVMFWDLRLGVSEKLLSDDFLHCVVTGIYMGFHVGPCIYNDRNTLDCYTSHKIRAYVGGEEAQLGRGESNFCWYRKTP